MTAPETLYAWSSGFASAPQPVGMLAPNPWGIYDMHGNVYSWVLDRDWPNNQSGDAETDPRGAGGTTSRILAGTRFGTAVTSMRSSFATMSAPDKTVVNDGFGQAGVRLVCAADMTELAVAAEAE